MRRRPVIVLCLGCLALFGGRSLAARQGDDRLVSERTQNALAALDRYLETWNSRDPARWASSLHFPHVRPGPGAFELSATPEHYAANVDFSTTLKTGWHHSEWTARRVLQVGVNQVHIAGSWMRYTQDGREITGSAITYIVTRQDDRWGVLSRFAAGPTGLDPKSAKANEAAARDALTAYADAFNSHDAGRLATTMHFPFVRIADGRVELWKDAAEFLAGSEPGRQRTWYATSLDQVEVTQVAASGVNIAVTYSRLDRQRQVLSRSQAVVLVARRADGWKVQALSTLGA
jgi:hypothetical protein